MKKCVHRIVPLVVKRKGSRGLKSVKVCYGMLFCVDFCYDITNDPVPRQAHSPEGVVSLVYLQLNGGVAFISLIDEPSGGGTHTSTLGRTVKAAWQRFTLPGSSPGALIGYLN